MTKAEARRRIIEYLTHYHIFFEEINDSGTIIDANNMAPVSIEEIFEFFKDVKG